MQPDEQSQLYLMLGEIRGDLKSILASLAGQQVQHDRLREEVDTRLNNHAERIERVERFHWKVIGIAAAIPTVLGIAGLAIAVLL